jgi:hypothetical protein
MISRRLFCGLVPAISLALATRSVLAQTSKPLALPSHGRYDYSSIKSRKPYRWPNGTSLAVYLALNLEHFAFGEGLGAELAPGGPQPDILNFARLAWAGAIEDREFPGSGVGVKEVIGFTFRHIGGLARFVTDLCSDWSLSAASRAAAIPRATRTA